MNLLPEPAEGIPIISPVRNPLPGEVLIGYEIVYQDCPICVRPNPLQMNYGGWLMVALTTAIFWPLMCIPCCLSSSYTTAQRPVYMFPEHRSRSASLDTDTRHNSRSNKEHQSLKNVSHKKHKKHKKRKKRKSLKKNN